MELTNDNNGSYDGELYFDLTIPMTEPDYELAPISLIDSVTDSPIQKTEPDYEPLTPISFIDSPTDRTKNGNTENPMGLSSAPIPMGLTGSSDPSTESLFGPSSNDSLRSSLEELSFGDSDELGSIPISELLHGTETLALEPISVREMDEFCDSFDLQSSPPPSNISDTGSGSSGGATTSDFSSNSKWLLNADGDVMILTDSLDPVSVISDQVLSSTTPKSSNDSNGVNTTTLMGSADLTSSRSSFQHGDHTYALRLTTDLSVPTGGARQVPPHSQFMLYEPSTSAQSSMLLRTTLQNGNGTRRPSYPFMTRMSSSTSSLPRTSTYTSPPTSGGEVYYQVHSPSNLNQSYQLRLVEPMFNQGTDIPLPVTQPKRQPPQQTQPIPQHPTTSSSRWSNATQSRKSGPGGPVKTIQRRKRQTKPKPPSSSIRGQNQRDGSQQPGTSSGNSSPHPRSGRGRGSNSRSRMKEGPPTHPCNFCNKGFYEHYTWMVHERVHTGEKPYSCEFCDRGFSQKAHLVKHKDAKVKCHERNYNAKLKYDEWIRKNGPPKAEEPEDDEKDKNMDEE